MICIDCGTEYEGRYIVSWIMVIAAIAIIVPITFGIFYELDAAK